MVAGCAPAPATAPSTQTSAHDGHHDPHAHGDHAQGFHHRFDDAERWSKEFDDPARDAWQKPASVVALMALREGMRVADVGAGTGYFEPHLARAVGATGRVFALDVEPSMVEFIRKRAARDHMDNVEAKAVSPGDPGLAPASVDRVLVVDTWHHLDDRKAYAAKLAAALSPGGMVVVVDFTKEAQHGPPPAHRLSAAEVSAELEAGGLRARIAEEDLPEQYVVIAVRP